MDVLLLIAAFCVFCVLAARFGYDSRDTLRSQEHIQAELGLTWPIPRPVSRSGVPRRSARSVRFRRRLASALYRFADWLYPLRPAGGAREML
jgi:hypothetical protein